ncbi:Na+/H+ antiporter subunit C [Gellertiella hungarica]|uniref:Multicomponent Na+:H+ antiporter subunit C n=1 Tax=Gellertiella hungarica TaxID=1572859 RepID=A0A7W6J8B4_9HYPH|nr:Na+/H+ antiporter subunit C [Gellertiella hungarica]MBB4065763.1 multicomponent Na+:H+ antiporter subunit C [Gellertiella hungarica]
MEAILALLSTAFLAAAFYLLLSRHVVRMLIGVALLGNGVNLSLFLAGRLTRGVPPVMGAGEEVLKAGAANPLPQALILTAIVISFSFFAFLLVLGYRAYQTLGTDDTRAMRFAEPDRLDPPTGY